MKLTAGNGFGLGQMSHALAWLYFVTDLEPERLANDSMQIRAVEKPSPIIHLVLVTSRSRSFQFR